MLPGFLEAVSVALHRVVEESEFLPVEESDARLQAFEQKMTVLRRTATSRPPAIEGEAAVVHEAEALRERIPNVEVALFRAQSKWCGAIRCTAHEVLSHLADLVSLDQEDVIACSADVRVGIFCSLDSRDDEDLAPAYCIITWADYTGSSDVKLR